MDKREIERKVDAIFKLITKEYSSNIGLLGGQSGMILFLYELAKVKRTKKYYTALERKIEGTFCELNNIDSVTYADGITGLAWIYNYLYKNEILDHGIQEFLVETDVIIRDNVYHNLKIKNFDFLHGFIGQGIYSIDRENVKLLNLIFENLYNTATLSNNGACWVSDYIIDNDFNSKKVYDLSLSHGSSAIIVFLCKLIQVKSFNFSKKIKQLSLIRDAVTFILSSKLIDKESIFPTICEIHNTKESDSSRLAWCYGDLSISIALWQAGITLKDEKIKQEAIKICLHTTKRKTQKETGVVDAGICHGSAGLAHMYSRMWRYTGIEEFKTAYDYWIQETLKMAKYKDGLAGYKSYQSEAFGGWKNDYGLLEGIAGIGLVLHSYLYPEEEPHWDRCLLLS
jgi:lantibiotic modifying enzyme